MKRFGIAVAAAATLAVAPAAQAAWQPLGGKLNAADAPAAAQPVATTLDGQAYAAWVEGPSGSTDVRVARLGADGTWQPVGGALDRAAGSWSIEPAIGVAGGALYVAWAERAPREQNFEVHVSRLTGDGFAAVADPGDTANDTRSPSIAAVGGAPAIAFSEPDAQNIEIRVKQLSGTSWQAVGGLVNRSSRDAAAATAPLSLIDPPEQYAGLDPDLAVVGGVPHVAWSEQNALRVARLQDSAWQDVGGPLGSVPGEGELAAVGSSLFVAWREAGGTAQVMRFASGGWSAVAEPLPASGSGTTVSPLALGDELWVARTQGNRVRVVRLGSSGTAWEEPAVFGGTVDARDPVLFDAGGIPFVTWAEGFNAERKDVRVARLEPEILSTAVTVSGTSATFTTRMETYGLSYPLAHAYGPAGSALTSRTTTGTASGLQPRTAYEVRPVATAGVPAPEVVGGTVGFTTGKKNGR